VHPRLLLWLRSAGDSGFRATTVYAQRVAESTSIARDPEGHGRAKPVLGTFAKTQVPRRAGATPHIKTFQPFTRKLICHFERSEKSPPIVEREISPMGRNDKRGVIVNRGENLDSRLKMSGMTDLFLMATPPSPSPLKNYWLPPRMQQLPEYREPHFLSLTP